MSGTGFTTVVKKYITNVLPGAFTSDDALQLGLSFGLGSFQHSEMFPVSTASSFLT